MRETASHCSHSSLSTWIYQLDPRTKIACTIAVALAIFYVRSPLQLIASFVGIFTVIGTSKVSLLRLLRAIRPLMVVLILLGLLNLFAIQTGTTLVHLGPIRISSDGLWCSVLYPARFSIAVVMGALLLITTTPTQLTDAFDAALAPLAALGLPAHELAMVFSLMLRFIPTIQDEASAIIDAQTARGGGWKSGSPINRIRSIGPILIALLASSARHAADVSRALDARCYEGGARRTHWHPLRFGTLDALVALFCLGAIVCIVALGSL